MSPSEVDNTKVQNGQKTLILGEIETRTLYMGFYCKPNSDATIPFILYVEINGVQQIPQEDYLEVPVLHSLCASAKEKLNQESAERKAIKKGEGHTGDER